MKSSARTLTKNGHSSIKVTLPPEKENKVFQLKPAASSGSSPELHTAASPCVNIRT